MFRTTVYFDEEIGLSLRRLASAQGRPQAEIIREALQTYVSKAEKQLDNELPRGVGKYSSGRSDVSTNADSFLKRAARKRK